MALSFLISKIIPEIYPMSTGGVKNPAHRAHGVKIKKVILWLLACRYSGGTRESVSFSLDRSSLGWGATKIAGETFFYETAYSSRSRIPHSTHFMRENEYNYFPHFPSSLKESCAKSTGNSCFP